ncbi:MAG TPA: M1 family aminopeptidase [Rhodanobacteraceae bacterium]|nr:M1 family aminopeptidase [Rhodanobacteraceae bacterium]
MRVLLRAIFVAFALTAAVSSAAKNDVADEVPVGKLPPDAIPQHYSLHFSVDPRSERFSGETRIRVRLSAPADHVWLHAQQLEIAKATVATSKGEARPASTITHADAGVLEVRFGRTLPAGDIDLAFEYTAPFNGQLEGAYKVKVGDDAYIVTQMEPISARYAFPGFDEPRFKTPFDITLTVPTDEVAVANTRQLDEKKSTDGKWKTMTFATTKPLPTYLVAFAVGPWDVVDAPPIPPNSVRKNPIPLRGIAPRGKGKKLAWVLGETPAVIKFYEDYTAQPYPFDKLDLLGAPDFSAGAMENAGLIVYRDALLLLDEHSPAERYRSVFNVNAHEIAHQWYGDLVTVPWWDDIWLNEAYATWAQRKATVALKPEYFGDLESLEFRLATMKNDSLLTARKVRQPINGHGDIETAFDNITYQKGASVLAMFETWVGEETFRRGMRDYLANHRFGSGNADDLIASLGKASGRREMFAKSMSSFLDQPGIPLVHTAVDCKDGHASLSLGQSRYLPYGVLGEGTPRWSAPVCTRFGRGAESDTQCFVLDQSEQRFPLEGACPDWYLPNAQARGYYRFEMTPADLSHLGDAVQHLSAPEQVVYADALNGAFQRGDLGPTAILDAMPHLAGSDTPHVATALFAPFEWIREELADDAARSALDAYAISIYKPRLEQMSYRRRDGDASTTIALRARLAGFLALTVRDAGVRAELVKQGRAALGLDGSGKVDLSRADPDLLRSALKVTVQEDGARAFEAAQQELAVNRDTARRYALLAALGATRDPALAEKARDFGLDQSVQIGEIANLYEAQASEPENRIAMWQWLQTHYEPYRARLPAFRRGYMPKIFAEGRCSAGDADELSAFFAPRIKDLVGGDRGLGQTLETIRQCASLREHIGPRALAGWIETRESSLRGTATAPANAGRQH